MSTPRAAFFALLLAAPAVAGGTPDFQVIASSGGFNNGLNTVLRFDRDGDRLGDFAAAGLNGLNDPRDVFLNGSFGDSSTSVLINSGSDQILEYDQSGRFLGVFAELDPAPQGPGAVNPGGGVFGTNGNVFIGSRSQATIFEYDGATGAFLGEPFPLGTVEFPRGFVFTPDGDFFLGSGANPGTGAGANELLRVASGSGAPEAFFGQDQLPEFSPLDVITSPDGTLIVVSNEFPFTGGSIAAANRGTVVVIDAETGELVANIDPNDGLDEPIYTAPRGLGFGPDGLLYASSTGTGDILRFAVDAASDEYSFVDVFATVEPDALNAQALTFVVPTDVCPADLNRDGELDFDDVNGFAEAFLAREPVADLNEDGVHDLIDVTGFIESFTDGCP